MSFTAAHESKQARRSCESCRRRKARFQYRGAVGADRHNTLCFACFRSARDRRRAQLMAEVPPAGSLRSPFRPKLTDRQIAHRRAMLVHLQRALGHATELSLQAPS